MSTKSKTILQHTSKRQKALVKQAMSLEGPAHAKKMGWAYVGRGLTCVAYAKRNIVVKFYNHTHYILSIVSVYFNILPNHRKYFTRILAYDDDKIVQPRVLNKKVALTDREMDKINELSDFYDFCDIEPGWNVGKLNGRISIYDLSHEEPINK